MIDLTTEHCVIVMTIALINEILNRKHTVNNDEMINIRYYDSTFIKSHFTLKFFPSYETDVSFLSRITGREITPNRINRRIHARE